MASSHNKSQEKQPNPKLSYISLFNEKKKDIKNPHKGILDINTHHWNGQKVSGEIF